MEHFKTAYYGIDVVFSRSCGYWIVSDNEDNKYFDHYPTDEEVKEFRDQTIDNELYLQANYDLDGNRR